LEYWKNGFKGILSIKKKDFFRFEHPIFHDSIIPSFQMGGLLRWDRRYFNLRWL